MFEEGRRLAVTEFGFQYGTKIQGPLRLLLHMRDTVRLPTLQLRASIAHAGGGVKFLAKIFEFVPPSNNAGLTVVNPANPSNDADDTFCHRFRLMKSMSYENSAR